MALQTVNSNSAQPLGGPNMGLGTDQGDSFDTLVSKINAMMSELYGRTGGSSSLGASGLVPSQLPLTDATTTAGVFLTATPGSGAFGISETAGTSIALTGESTSASSKTDAFLIDYVLPANYIAGQNITFTVNCQQAGAGTVTVETVNANAYLVANAGTMGSDLINVSAKTITASAADYAFTIAGAGLVPGSHLVLKVTTVITTSAGAANSQINSIRTS